MLRKILTCAVAAAAIGTATVQAGAQAAGEINFGVISTEASINQKKNWEPFVQAMSAATGLKVNAFYASDYAGVIEAMRFGKVQVAWFGNKSAMEAVDRANGEVFAQVVSRDGSAGYYSHLIVHKDSPYKTVDDLLKCDKSLDFGIGDPNSTSGFLVPTAYIFAARDIDPKACFKTVRNASHQVNAMAVANKLVAAATNNSEDLERVEKNAPEARANIRVIWTSPMIPLDPLVWRKDLDPTVKTKLYTFLMSYGRISDAEHMKGDRTILANLLWSPFSPSSDNQLLPIRLLEVNKTMAKIKADDKLSAEEKAKQIEPLRAQIAELTELQKKAESDAFHKRKEQFLVADKAGDQAALKKMIAEFASGSVPTN